MATRTYSSITGQPVVLPNVFEVEQVSTFAIAATSANPTPGTATYLRTTARDGEYAWIKWEFAQTAGGSAGTGAYRFGMPSGLTPNTAKILAGGIKYVGSGRLDAAASYVASAFVSGSEIGVVLSNDTQAPAAWGSTLVPLNNTSIQITIICRIPILEWAGAAMSAYGAGLVTGSKPGLVNFMSPETVLTVTCGQAGFTVVRAVGIAYADTSGIWRARFNIVATFTSASITTLTLAITGTLFKNLTSFDQAVYAFYNGTAIIPRAVATNNSANISITSPAASSTTSITVSGDVELDAKPSWA